MFIAGAPAEGTAWGGGQADQAIVAAQSSSVGSRSSRPLVVVACRPLPTTETAENRNNAAHGYQLTHAAA